MQGLMVCLRPCSMTFSTCVVYNIWCLGTINFLESKAITECRSAIFAHFGAS